MHAKKEFISYKVNTSTSSSETLDDEILNKGYLTYPFRILSGFSYTYKNTWEVAGDYTYQKMSDYEEFGTKQQLKRLS